MKINFSTFTFIFNVILKTTIQYENRVFSIYFYFQNKFKNYNKIWKLIFQQLSLFWTLFWELHRNMKTLFKSDFGFQCYFENMREIWILTFQNWSWFSKLFWKCRWNMNIVYAFSRKCIGAVTIIYKQSIDHIQPAIGRFIHITSITNITTCQLLSYS